MTPNPTVCNIHWQNYRNYQLKDICFLTSTKIQIIYIIKILNNNSDHSERNCHFNKANLAVYGQYKKKAA